MHCSFQECTVFVLCCCAAYWKYFFALFILSQILHVSIGGNDLSGCVCSAVQVHCGTHLMVLFFQLSRSMDEVSALWCFPPCLHPGFSSKDTNPNSYIDVAHLGRLLTHLQICGRCCMLEKILIFQDAASSGTGIYSWVITLSLHKQLYSLSIAAIVDNQKPCGLQAVLGSVLGRVASLPAAASAVSHLGVGPCVRRWVRLVLQRGGAGTGH